MGIYTANWLDWSESGKQVVPVGDTHMHTSVYTAVNNYSHYSQPSKVAIANLKDIGFIFFL